MSNLLNTNALRAVPLTRRRALLLAGSSALALSGCSRTDDYALTWEEEVILHDGRRLWVTVTRHMKRFRALYSTGFVTRDYPKDVEISFDAGPPFGKFHRRFVGHMGVRVLELRDKKMYLRLDGGGDVMIPQTIPLVGTWVIEADGREYALSSNEEMLDLPICNMLPWGGLPQDYDRFAGHRISWTEKWNWWKDYTRDGSTEFDSFISRKTLRTRLLEMSNK